VLAYGAESDRKLGIEGEVRTCTRPPTVEPVQARMGRRQARRCVRCLHGLYVILDLQPYRLSPWILYVEVGQPDRFAPCCRARPALRRMHAALWGRRSAALLGIGR